MFCTKNTIICLVLEVANPSVAPSLGRFQNDDKMTSKSAPVEVIEVPDEEDQPMTSQILDLRIQWRLKTVTGTRSMTWCSTDVQ